MGEECHVNSKELITVDCGNPTHDLDPASSTFFNQVEAKKHRNTVGIMMMQKA
jgi:hypothetical protein